MHIFLSVSVCVCVQAIPGELLNGVLQDGSDQNGKGGIRH